MTIIVTGSSGQLGSELLRHGKRFGLKMTGLDLPEWDMTNRTHMENAVSRYRPSLILNAAAYTNVDGAETEKDLAFAVNKDAPSHLAKLCSRSGIPLIHFSTDYVFSGDRKFPYRETDPVSPASIYGQSKLAGENGVRSFLREHMIIRTSWLYGVYGHNFVKTMLRLGKEKESIQVVADQFGCPTSAEDLAESAFIIVSKIYGGIDMPWGTYHYCGRGITTWHEFSQSIFETARTLTSIKVRHVEAVSSDKFPGIAPRPAFSALDCDHIKMNLGIQTKPWRQSLKIMINRLFNGSPS